jgi:hypothetical protein
MAQITPNATQHYKSSSLCAFAPWRELFLWSALTSREGAKAQRRTERGSFVVWRLLLFLAATGAGGRVLIFPLFTFPLFPLK